MKHTLTVDNCARPLHPLSFLLLLFFHSSSIENRRSKCSLRRVNMTTLLEIVTTPGGVFNSLHLQSTFTTPVVVKTILRIFFYNVYYIDGRLGLVSVIVVLIIMLLRSSCNFTCRSWYSLISCALVIIFISVMLRTLLTYFLNIYFHYLLNKFNLLFSFFLSLCEFTSDGSHPIYVMSVEIKIKNRSPSP